jgi:hypothetical protein
VITYGSSAGDIGEIFDPFILGRGDAKVSSFSGALKI